MQPEDIRLGDWARILFGEVPAVFFLEVILRSAFLYVLLVAAMRLMGKRMAAQLSRNERAAMVSLAAAIGVPLQSPDRGLLPALVIALIVVLAGRAIAMIAFHHQRFEKATQGNVDMLVTDGVLEIHNMKRTRITRERVLSALRNEGITHLGQVQRLYMEAAGAFTCIREADPKPGLSIIPRWDTGFYNSQDFSGSSTVCSGCGNRQRAEENRCTCCGRQEWEQAVSP